MARLSGTWRVAAMLKELIGGLFSALWQGLLGLLGISDAQKLGRLEAQDRQDKASLSLSQAQLKAIEDAPDEKTALREGKF